MSDELSALKSTIGDSNQHPIAKYHSFFYNLLTWQHPRASAVILLTLVSAILVSRFVNVPKLAFRALWVGLLSTMTLEVVGRFVFRSKQGLVSQFAPQQLYTIPRSSLDPIFDETHSLLNFGFAEVQRLLYVRNVRHSAVAFVNSFIAYQLIKVLPVWALLIIGTTLAFALPPLYIRHRETIDAHINQAAEIGQQHYNNAVDLASKHANEAAEKARLAAIDLGNKAGVDVQRYVGGPGPVTSTSVQDELAKQPILTDAKPKADSPFTNKVPTNGTPVEVPAATELRSPPVESHTADHTTHDDKHVEPVASVKNTESIAI